MTGSQYILARWAAQDAAVVRLSPDELRGRRLMRARLAIPAALRMAKADGLPSDELAAAAAALAAPTRRRRQPRHVRSVSAAAGGTSC